MSGHPEATNALGLRVMWDVILISSGLVAGAVLAAIVPRVYSAAALLASTVRKQLGG